MSDSQWKALREQVGEPAYIGWWFDNDHPNGGFSFIQGQLPQTLREHRACTRNRCFLLEPVSPEQSEDG